MIHPDQGEIVMVKDFPFTNLTDFNKRPALVISKDKYIGDDFVCFGITSNLTHLESLSFDHRDLD